MRRCDWLRITDQTLEALHKIQRVAAHVLSGRRGADTTTAEHMAELDGVGWVLERRSVLLTGATACGKTWLACAPARQAARAGHAVLYTRTARRL